MVEDIEMTPEVGALGNNDDDEDLLIDGLIEDTNDDNDMQVDQASEPAPF